MNNSANISIWGSFPYKSINSNTPFLSSHLQFQVVIREVACGAEHILFLSDQELYGIGNNQCGQLGLVDASEVVDTPRRLPIQKEVKSVACGDYFSVILTYDGDVYCSGEGSFGATGDGLSKNSVGFNRVLQGIQSISSGNRHVLALNKYGIVYGWGDNQQGQLGSKSFGKIVPQPKILNIRDVTQISAHRNISLFLKGKEQGDEEIYACGGNDLGQLGIGNKSITYEIQKVDFDKPVQYIEAGNYSCIYSDGEYYLFGSGAFGELLYPVKIHFPHIKSLFLGETFGFYKDISGLTFGWGSNLHGEMGMNEPTRIFNPTPMQHLNIFKEFICAKNFVIGLWGNEAQTMTRETGAPQLVSVESQNQQWEIKNIGLQRQVQRLKKLLKDSKPEYFNVLSELEETKKQNLKLKEQIYLLKEYQEPRLKTEIDRSQEQKTYLRTLLKQMAETSSDNYQNLVRINLEDHLAHQRSTKDKDMEVLRARGRFGDLLNRVETNQFLNELFEVQRNQSRDKEERKKDMDSSIGDLVKHTGTLRKIIQEIREELSE